MKKLIIGLGTGRVGTTSLARFLSAQPNSFVSHELENDADIQRLLPLWGEDWERIREALERLIAHTGDVAYVGDVAMWYLPYVPQIIQHFPGTVFICLKRDREQVIASFLKKIPTGDRWRSATYEGWNRVFPKYFSSPTKAHAIGCYWDDYYRQAEQYARQYPEFKIAPTEVLNTYQGMNMLLDHAGYPVKSRSTTAVFWENTYSTREYFLQKFKYFIRKAIGGVWYEKLKFVYYQKFKRYRFKQNALP